MKCPEQQQSNDRKRFYGKYRGIVVDNKDPKGQGRILARVAAVPGAIKNYATPCVPYAGPGVGFFFIPPIDAKVWIEFEGGDPNFPIWSGAFWENKDEMPEEATSPDIKIFKTKHITMKLDDSEKNKGGFKLTCKSPAVKTGLSMVFDSNGITIKCPQSTITMTKDSISLANSKSKITMKSNAVNISVPKSQLEVTSQKINIQAPPAKLTMDSESIDVNATKINTKAAKLGVETTASLNVDGGGRISAKAGNVSITGLVKMN